MSGSMVSCPLSWRMLSMRHVVGDVSELSVSDLTRTI